MAISELLASVADPAFLAFKRQVESHPRQAGHYLIDLAEIAALRTTVPDEGELFERHARCLGSLWAWRLALIGLAMVLGQPAYAAPPPDVMLAVAEAPCSCVMEVAGVDKRGDTVGTCRMVVAGVCPRRPVHLAGSGAELRKHFVNERLPPTLRTGDRAPGPGSHARGAVILAGLVHRHGVWSFTWATRWFPDYASYLGAWIYLLPSDAPTDVVHAFRLLRASARRGWLSRSQWTHLDTLLGHTSSITAITTLLTTRRAASGPPDSRCVDAIERHRPIGGRIYRSVAHLPQTCIAAAPRLSAATVARGAWLLSHPGWVYRRLPLECGYDTSRGPNLCVFRTPSALVNALGLWGAPTGPMEKHARGFLGSVRGRSILALGRAAGMSIPASVGTNLMRWPPGLMARIFACYYAGASKAVPASCPRGRLRLGAVFLPSGKLVLDAPGDSWPGPRPWRK